MITAAEIGACWVILCLSVACGLFLGERVWVMLRLHCDWADAGARQRLRAKKRYAKHATPRAVSRPVAAAMGPAMARASRVLADPTHVIPAVQDETVITGVAAGAGEQPTQTFVRPVVTDVRKCCGTREGTGHLASCDPADRECPSHPGRYGDH